ncbi:MAG: sugar phosphate isomerase/epimerase [Cyclobacteriaceae bacterium]
MNKTHRRNFIKIAGLAVSGTFMPRLSAGTPRFKGSKEIKLGIASYTFREFSLEDTIRMTNKVDIDNIALKSMHLPLEKTDDEIRDVKNKIEKAGIKLYGAGVIYMKNEDEVENAFRYAKAAGMKTIIGVPNHDLLDLVEKKVKETDIQVAIHNHGPGDDLYPSPESIIEKVGNRDKRIGMCMDIGHTQRIGLDPASEALKYFDRLLDVHLKDVDKSTPEGDTVEIGRGIIDIKSFLQVLLENQYSGIASFEYEKDGEDPLAGLAESIGYVKGVLSLLK